MMTSCRESELAHMAEHFYGYGRWDAPFWFIGPEAGMGKDGKDSLAARYESWRQLGCAPVVDCEKHHRGFGMTKWHVPRPKHKLPTQATWRQLIRLLLAYKGLPDGVELIREYQRVEWGSETGETCVIELSGLAAPNMQEPQDRTTFLSKRIERIQEEARKHRPEFILMYSTGQLEEWKKIAGGELDANGLCRMGKTIAAIARHPTDFFDKGEVKNAYYFALGEKLAHVAKMA